MSDPLEWLNRLAWFPRESSACRHPWFASMSKSVRRFVSILQIHQLHTWLVVSNVFKCNNPRTCKHVIYHCFSRMFFVVFFCGWWFKCGSHTLMWGYSGIMVKSGMFLAVKSVPKMCFVKPEIRLYMNRIWLCICFLFAKIKNLGISHRFISNKSREKMRHLKPWKF